MFYRGADLESLNQDEFLDNTIDGEEIEVIEVDFPPGEGTETYKFQDTSNFLPYITDTRTVDITGGLTPLFTAATNFTKTRFPPGLVLVMDETNIPADVVPVEYDPEWFDAHPGVLGHVTTLYDGEMHEDSRIVGLMDGRNLREYRRSEIENEATANRYTSEREMVAFANEIWLDDAVEAVVCVRGTTGVSPYTLSASLSEHPRYRVGSGGVKDVETRERVAGPEDYEAQAEVLYEKIEEVMDYDGAPLYLVAVDSMNDIRSDDGAIDPDNFRFVYNGTGFGRDYQRNSKLLGV